MDIDIPTLIDIVSRLKQENGWTRIQWKKVAAAYVVAVLGQWTREEQTELALKKSFQKTLSTLYRNRDIKGWRRKKSETVEEVVHSTDNSTVRVPEDCKTLKEAVERVHKIDRLTTIVLGKGEHQIDGNYLEISSAMNIVGDRGCRKRRLWSWVGFSSSRDSRELSSATPDTASSEGEWSVWRVLFYDGRCPCGTVWWYGVFAMVLVSSEDVPTWKCGNVERVEWLHTMVPPSH